MSRIAIKMEPTDISNTDFKSNKTIRMNNVMTPQIQPGRVFDRQKANAALMKAAYFVGSI